MGTILLVNKYWRGSMCLGNDSYMYVKRGFARHKCLLSCT